MNAFVRGTLTQKQHETRQTSSGTAVASCILLGLNYRKKLSCASFLLPCYKSLKIQLKNMARTNNFLEDFSAKEAHSRYIPVIYKLPGNQGGP